MSYYLAEVIVLGFDKGGWFRAPSTPEVFRQAFLIDDVEEPETRYELEHLCYEWEKTGHTVRTYWRELLHFEYAALKGEEG